MSQKALADAIGLAAATPVSDWVTGKRQPKPTNIQRIAEALDVDPKWLQGQDPNEGSPAPGLPALEDAAGELSGEAAGAFFRLMDHGRMAVDIARMHGWRAVITVTVDGRDFGLSSSAVRETQT